MNSSLNSLHHTPSTIHPPINHILTTSPKLFHHRHFPNPKPYLHRSTTFTTFCSIRRRRHLRRRRHNNNNFPTTDTDSSSPYTDSKLHMIIDFDQYIPDKASISFNRLLRTAELKFNQFVDSGSAAVEDLRTVIAVDGHRRVVVSCRKSTVYFLGQLIALSLVTVFTFRVLVKLGLGFRNLVRGRGDKGEVVVTRRDRSLGGREVVVSTRKELRKELSDVNPLSSVEDSVMSYSSSVMKNWEKSKKKLPDWWPDCRPGSLEGVDKEENQLKANWLIRAIMDYRTSGKDIHEDDIILLRRICRMSGVNVFIDTSNSRDSIYRASVDFTLNTCGRVASHSTFVQIDGEDAREFLAGLADNIGLESSRAARMVAAAVAARTRSWLLQAWALEMQGKHIEAVDELSKLCLIHRIFPPDEGSPEMEMVARGLEKHLKLEQRVYLLKMLIGVSSEENRRSLVEALGLETSAGMVGDDQENMVSQHEDDQER